MGSTTIAVDLAKSIFEVAVSDHPGRIAENHRLSRDRMMRFFAEREADSGLPDLLRSVLAEAHVDIRELEEHVVGVRGHQALPIGSLACDSVTGQAYRSPRPGGPGGCCLPA